MRTFRTAAILGLALVPLTLAWPAPQAHAGGGFGMTLTASLDHLSDPDPRFLTGTHHTVFAALTDDGEASLRDIRVDIADLDPAEFPVTCDTGVNGSLSLEPGQTLHCTAPFSAETGLRTIVVLATAQIPGVGSQSRTRSLHYTGFMPPPAPGTAPAARASISLPSHHSAPLQPSGGVPAAGAPAADPPAAPVLMAPPPPLGAGAGGEPAGDPPAAPGVGCPAGTGAAAAGCCGSGAGAAAGGAGCCAGAAKAAGVQGPTTGAGCPGQGPNSQGMKTAGARGLPHTGTSAPLLAVLGLAVLGGGVALVRAARGRAARKGVSAP